eukprot:gnl/Chilomastix_cuspidata/212.p1 GENE.gnl/Chilomastix_cuspidata/212~~gnl/Chilomastix_cuspidata/212.p1  ORF type:complete len:259 (-),score=107.77 gnl/Chilomastix_cuspidata/212:794-1570(-)
MLHRIFFLLTLLSLAVCGPMAPKSKPFDVVEFVGRTKTISMEFEQDGADKLTFDGKLLSTNKEDRVITGTFWDFTLKEVEEEEKPEKIEGKHRLFKIESANATAVAFFVADALEGEDATPEWELLHEFTLEMEKGGPKPVQLKGKHGESLLVKVISQNSAEVTIVDGEHISTLRILRTADMPKQSLVQRLIMPLATMLPMQFMQYRQRKKAQKEAAASAQDAQAAQAASSGNEEEEAGEEAGEGEEGSDIADGFVEDE